MNSNALEKCVAIAAIAIIAIVGLWVSKGGELASMAIGAIAGFAGSGIVSGVGAVFRSPGDVASKLIKGAGDGSGNTP